MYKYWIHANAEFERNKNKPKINNMKSKVVYVAHPIGGNIEENLKDLYRIFRYLNLNYQDITFIAPYIADVNSLNDSEASERARGIKNNTELFKRRVMDEVWLTGDRISEGMQGEIEMCRQYDIVYENKLGQF